MTHRRRASATDNSAVIERLERERDDLRASLDNCKADLQSEKHRRRTCAVQCERLREALGEIAESHDAGRHDGLPEE